MTAVVITQLCKRFRPTTAWSDLLKGRFRREEVTALSGVDLQVQPGELVGIAGPNGAGKSTLLRCVAGLLLPSSGTLEVFGRSSVKNDTSYRQLVGYALGAERSHFWRLTGRENLRFFAALHGYEGTDRKNKVTELLGLVDLLDDAERPVREYSTGMRQKLSIARGLLGTPELLLLDEPTRGLDPRAANRVRTFVKDVLVKERGVTVLYATHQVDEMREFCPRLLIMNAGRVVGDGSFNELSETFAEVFA